MLCCGSVPWQDHISHVPRGQRLLRWPNSWNGQFGNFHFLNQWSSKVQVLTFGSLEFLPICEPSERVPQCSKVVVLLKAPCSPSAHPHLGHISLSCYECRRSFKNTQKVFNQQGCMYRWRMRHSVGVLISMEQIKHVDRWFLSLILSQIPFLFKTPETQRKHVSGGQFRHKPQRPSYILTLSSNNTASRNSSWRNTRGVQRFVPKVVPCAIISNTKN